MTRSAGAILVAMALVACSGSTTDTAPTGVEAPPATTVEPTAATTESATDMSTVEGQGPEAATDARSITVGGMGSEYGAPTRTIVDIGVNARRPSVAEASAAVSGAGAALVAALEDAGVPATGIQTSGFWINPYFDQMNYQLIAGYEASIDYNVVIADVGSVGGILGQVIQAGGDSVRASGIRFEVDPAGLMDVAREEAWADVEARAQATADLTGEPLGVVLDVHEKVLMTSPQGMMQGGEGDAAAFDVPVSPGVAGVIVLLTVTYAIGE